MHQVDGGIVGAPVKDEDGVRTFDERLAGAGVLSCLSGAGRERRLKTIQHFLYGIGDIELIGPCNPYKKP